MSLVFEVGLICDLQPDLSPQITDVLTYMTRSQDYDFDMSIDHRFFENKDLEDEWRYIIANNYPRVGEEDWTQIKRSSFSNGQLCFRVVSDDDTFYNVGYDLLDWLASISGGRRLTGFMNDLYYFDVDFITLIYFRNGEVKELRLPRSEDAALLIETINTELGGSGFMHPFLS